MTFTIHLSGSRNRPYILLRRNNVLGDVGRGGKRRYYVGMSTVFPHPDHDHSTCVSETLARAEEACGDRGLRLTPLRRRVLETLAGSHAPLGAYEIVEKLKKTKEAPAMSVYRALEFLQAEGLVHRIESKNAFLACTHGHDSADIVLFMLCEQCGTVAEVTSGALGRELAQAAKSASFSPKAPVLEVSGLCARCRERRTRKAG
jgi:Fur family zinc uptake transcriptional regulator